MTADQATATAESVRALTAAEPPRFSGPQAITNELIDAVANGHCGWSRKQLEILGVPWPAKSGWRQRLVAEERTLAGELVASLYATRKTKRPENPDGPNLEGSLTPMPCPWCRRLVEPVMQGGNTREFCSRRHKNSYNAALNKLSIAYARTIRVPGSLKIWAEQRVDPSSDGQDGLPQTTQGAEPQDSPQRP